MNNDFPIADEITRWALKRGRRPRILFIVESSNEFEHFNSVSEIAGKACELGSEVAVASGTLGQEMSTSFNFFGIRQYDLPPAVARCTTETGNVQINRETGQTYSEDTVYQPQRAEVVQDIAEEFQPDIIVTEMSPFFCTAQGW